VVVPVTANDIKCRRRQSAAGDCDQAHGRHTPSSIRPRLNLYTAPLGFSGVVTFTYRDVNTTHTSAPATVTITVNPRNLPPVAVDDSYTLDQRTSVAAT